MSGETPEFHIGFKYGAQSATPKSGRPEFLARYMLDGSNQWFWVKNTEGNDRRFGSRVAAERAALEAATEVLIDPARKS